MSMAVPTCAENWKCPLLLCITQVSCCQTKQKQNKKVSERKKKLRFMGVQHDIVSVAEGHTGCSLCF